MTSHDHHRLAARLCGLGFAVLTNSGFAATNLLTNPTFDVDLGGWDNQYSRTASWNPLDANASPTSGSALVVNDIPSNGGTPLVLTKCLQVTPSTEYAFGGRLRVPAAQPASTFAQIYVETFASADCVGEALLIQSASTSTVEVWEFASGSIATGPGTHSILFGIGVFKPDGVTENASAHYDNLFLEAGEGQVGFTINKSISASWYNPAESGHGIMIHLLDPGSAWMCWFTFDLAGHRAWICSLGTITGDTLDFPNAFVVEGGKFPPLFDPGAIVEAPWGHITVTFTGCDNGTLTWTTSTTGFQSGSMPIARLTPLWGNPCV